MKSRSLITLAAVPAWASVSGYAQSSRMRASVPFEFTVGRTVLPAGDYAVPGISSLGGARLQATNPGSGTFVSAVWAARDDAQVPPASACKSPGRNCNVL
jgi:hypothetical protein